MSRFITSLVAVTFAGLLQGAPWFSIAGVKPDLVLVLTFIFFLIIERDWIERLALVLVAELAIQFTALPDIYGFVFIFITVACGFVMDRVRLQPRLMLIFAILVSTIVLNATGPLQPLVTAEEIFYNLVLAAALYLIIELIYGKKVFAR